LFFSVSFFSATFKNKKAPKEFPLGQNVWLEEDDLHLLDLNHFEWNVDDGFVVFTGFQHVFVIFLVVPVDDHILTGVFDHLQFLEYIQDAFGRTGVEILQIKINLLLLTREYNGVWVN